MKKITEDTDSLTSKKFKYKFVKQPKIWYGSLMTEIQNFNLGIKKQKKSLIFPFLGR